MRISRHMRLFYRVIAAILIGAFVAYDVAWAYPDDGGNLAVPGLQNKELLAKVKVALIIDLIEKRAPASGGLLPKIVADLLLWHYSYNTLFEGVEFEPIRRGEKVEEVWLKVITRHDNLIIRYFEPSGKGSRAFKVPEGYEDITNELSDSYTIHPDSPVHRQVLEKIVPGQKPRPAPKKEPEINMEQAAKPRGGPALRPGMWTLVERLVEENPSLIAGGPRAADALFDEKFDEFMKQDFRGKGPKIAMAYYSEFKAFYKAARDIAYSKKSGVLKPKSESTENFLDTLDEFNRYIKVKLSWIFSLDGFWSDMRGAAEAQDHPKMRSAAELLLSRHTLFMVENSYAGLLAEDECVLKAIKAVEAISKGRQAPSADSEPDKKSAESIAKPAATAKPAVPAKPAEAEKPAATAKPAEPAKPTLKPEKTSKEESGKRSFEPIKIPLSKLFMDQLKRMNWKLLIVLSLVSLPVSWLLTLILPVNIFTVSVAFILPIICFFLFEWTWTGLFVTIAVSVALSALLPIPWFGLSFAAILIGNTILHGGTLGFHFKPAKRVKGLQVYKEKETAVQKESKPETEEAVKEAKPEVAAVSKEVSDAGKRKEEKPTGKEGALVNITIDNDILGYMLEIIQAVHGKKAGKDAAGAKNIDDRSILEQLFAFEPFGDMPDYKSLKEELRPLVKEELKNIGQRFEFDDYRKALDKLKNWQNEKDMDLADALGELTQEVAHNLQATTTEDERKGEMPAIQELIGECCGISKNRFERIIIQLIAKRKREGIDSDKKIGTVPGEDYYILGILEFNAGNYASAEAAFERAVELESFRPEFTFSLGLMKHFLQKWDEAKKYYVDFIRVNKLLAKRTREDELRTELAELLVQKVDKRVPLIKGAPPKGSFIGKAYSDKAATQQVLSGVTVLEKNGFVEFCGRDGDILYTKDGKEARVKLTGEVLPVESGHAIKIIEDNEHIRGFADRNNVYVTKSLSRNPIAIYHEFKESYYARYPEQLPQGVNAHTFLRGCGTDIRELLSHRKITGLGAEELIEYLKKLLPPERYNENEFNLIRYNGTLGKKGKELIYGDQDRQFGVEANREFSKTIRENAPAASRRTFRSYEEIMFRDYFEDIFEKNIELFTLLSARMMTTGAERDKALQRRDELAKELLLLTEKYPYYMFREDGGFRNTVVYINNRIQRAVELIDEKDEPAAHWCLSGVVNKIRDARADLLKEWMERKRRYQQKLIRRGKVLMVSQGRYRVLDGGKRPIVDHAEIEFDTLWEAMRSVWDQVDSEMAERRSVMTWADSLDKLREMMRSADFKLSQDQMAAISRSISGIAAGMVKPGGELKVEEKRIAKLFLEAAVRILSLGDRHIRTVAVFMEKAESLFRLRLDNTASIIGSLHEGRLGAVMLEADRRDLDLIGNAKYAVKLLDAGKYTNAVEVMLGMTRLNELKGEPEYKGLHDVVWPAINAVREEHDPGKAVTLSKQASPYMQLVIRRCNEALFLRSMVKQYWDELVRRELSSPQPVDRKALIEEVFNKIADENVALRAEARGRARWWAKFYQAVNIPLKVDHPKDKTKRISNPVFEAASDYVFILGFGHVADALKKERVMTKDMDATKAYIGGIVSQRPHLIREDLPGLAEALIADHKLKGDQEAQLKACVRIEERSAEEAAKVKLAQENAAAKLLAIPAEAPKADAVLAAQWARAPPFLKSIHELFVSGRPALTAGPKILISEALLSEEDAIALRSVLGSEAVQILPAEAIRNAAMNGDASRSGLGCIITREEFNNLWKDSHRTNNKSTVLVLDEDMKDSRYLYIEGIIGLMRAMMNSDITKVRAYTALLFSTSIDDQVLEFLKKDNPIEFAIRAILKFKPIEPMRTEELQEYKKMVEAALAAA